MDPVATLDAGRRSLDPLLTRHGFRWQPGLVGKGSGGHFARGSYRRDERRLELHYRSSLGLVRYWVGARALEHVAYMRAVLGPAGGNRYPGFSSDPLDAFRDLAHDLEAYATVFLSGSEASFAQLVAHADAATGAGGIGHLP